MNSGHNQKNKPTLNEKKVTVRMTACSMATLWQKEWSVLFVRTVPSSLRFWSVRTRRSSWTK